jgi:hypothetical protein
MLIITIVCRQIICTVDAKYPRAWATSQEEGKENGRWRGKGESWKSKIKFKHAEYSWKHWVSPLSSIAPSKQCDDIQLVVPFTWAIVFLTVVIVFTLTTSQTACDRVHCIVETCIPCHNTERNNFTSDNTRRIVWCTSPRSSYLGWLDNARLYVFVAVNEALRYFATSA